MSLEDDGRTFLEHYGVPGMKWGKRKAREVKEGYTKLSPKQKTGVKIAAAGAGAVAVAGVSTVAAVGVGVAAISVLLARHGNKKAADINQKSVDLGKDFIKKVKSGG